MTTGPRPFGPGDRPAGPEARAAGALNGGREWGAAAARGVPWGARGALPQVRARVWAHPARRRPPDAAPGLNTLQLISCNYRRGRAACLCWDLLPPAAPPPAPSRAPLAASPNPWCGGEESPGVLRQGCGADPAAGAGPWAPRALSPPSLL